MLPFLLMPLPALQAPAPAPKAGPTEADLAQARSVVAACYKDHLRRRFGYDAASLKAKRRWFTPAVLDLVQKELNKPSKPDEVPYIDGDPFTNSQEPLRNLKVGAAKASGQGIEVALHLGGEGFARDFKVSLVRLGAGWRIDDLTYDDGTTLRGFLAAAPKE